MPDAIVVGSGPNGLAAAIALAQAGRSVVVFEAADTIGGGTRSAALTLPGFVHDVCSAVHPFALASPFFRTLPLASHGLRWIDPPAAIAHPFDDGSAVLVERSIERTSLQLGSDAGAYRSLMAWLVADWPKLEPAVLGPPHWPRHPLALARFGSLALGSASGVARRLFRGERARAVFAGIAAHAMRPLEMTLTAGVGLALGATAHLVGWPVPRGGSQRIADALASYLRSLGGEIVTGRSVRSLDDLPKARAILCDLTPRPLLRIAGPQFPFSYRRKLERYRYGLAAYKVDWALEGPIPWRAPQCAQAATVHLGDSLSEISMSEREAWAGRNPERPYVLVTQPSLFDPDRAPAGKHTAWAYCHVPNGSDFEMLGRVESQIERFAPGFRDRVLARSVLAPAELERRNANLIGGDIAGGVVDLRQYFTRPTRSLYSTPVKGLYICSSSTPPGVGVHGMCGFHAAQRALKEVLGG
jgi:phytoene dehydrogenase-like protein